jgi:uncharacterized protein (DUF342 family)
VAVDKKIRVEAETVEAALKEAERLLGKKGRELKVEVISQGRKGVLGIGARKAVIDAWVQEEGTERKRKDGLIRVLNGQVEVTDPEEGGLPPTLIVGQHLQVIINGENVEKSQEVSSRDEILLIPHCSEPEWKPLLRVTSDNFQAFLAIEKTRGKVYAVEDGGPDREMVVTARLEKTIEPEISPEEIEEYLRRAGITFGLVKSNLQELADCQEEREFLVAEGVRPLPPVDASVRVLFQEKCSCLQPPGEGENKMERVSLHQVISVEPGELLAEVVPPQPGKPGRDVKDQEVSPGEPKDIMLVAGPGVRVDEDGRKAFALISGRPEISGARVTVHPSYTISGDVDAKTGKVVFKGDVHVLGNVLDEMSVEAVGQVTINGFAANASIIAGSNVLVHRNIVGCTVRAGGLAVICNRFNKALVELVENLDKLAEAAGQLLHHPSVAGNKDIVRVGEGVILKMLLGSKFQELPLKFQENRQELQVLLDSFDYPEFKDLEKIYTEVSQRLVGNGPLGWKKLEEAKGFFADFKGRVEQVHVIIQEKAADQACLTATYVENSSLESSGNVVITGKGCYSSNIFAGNDVEIKGVPGVFRGGEIVAGGDVTVRELGSPAEVVTEIKINPGKTLRADRVFPGVIIFAGTRVERVTSERYGLVLTGE